MIILIYFSASQLHLKYLRLYNFHGLVSCLFLYKMYVVSLKGIFLLSVSLWLPKIVLTWWNISVLSAWCGMALKPRYFAANLPVHCVCLLITFLIRNQTPCTVWSSVTLHMKICKNKLHSHVAKRERNIIKLFLLAFLQGRKPLCVCFLDKR